MTEADSDLKVVVVGSSKEWYDWEEAQGVCHDCSGDGKFATTERAAYEPYLYPDELISCGRCGGSGRALYATG